MIVANSWGAMLRMFRKEARLSGDGLSDALSKIEENLRKAGKEKELEALKEIGVDTYVLVDKAKISKLEHGREPFPKIRSEHLAYIYVFHQKGEITLKQANDWLNLGDQRKIDKVECKVLFGCSLEEYEAKQKENEHPSEAGSKLGTAKSVTEDGKNDKPVNARHRPLELPRRADHFQGRKDEVAQLLTDLQPGKVVTLCGPGGIGKSALAAEAIWQLAPNDQPPDRFPDGIIYHSFYNQSQASIVLEHIAYSFGEELRPTPATAAQRALSGKRALLFLDGVEQADDLSSILNLCDHCAVLITSRRHKDAVAGWQDITSLPQEDAVALLKEWGGKRANNELAIHLISEIVGRLPLALRLVGRYLAENEENVIDYLKWLEATPLSALDHGWRQLESVPQLLTRSVVHLSKQAQQLLTVIGILTLAPFTWEMIAAGLSVAEGEVRHALGELVNYGLLFRHESSYEVTHALIHTYAREKSPPSSETTRQLASNFVRFIEIHQDDFGHLNLLRPHILSLLPVYLDQALWQESNTLSLAIDKYLDLQGHWIDRIAVLEIGLASTLSLQDRQSEGIHLGNLGTAYRNLGQLEKAVDYYQQAITIAQEIGDRQSESIHLGNWGTAYRELGHAEQSIIYHQRALTIAQEISDCGSEAKHLGNLGSTYYALGQMEKAVNYYQQAITIAQEIGNRELEGQQLGNLGNAYADLGEMGKAVGYYHQALAISQAIGYRRGEEEDLGNLGLAYAGLGQIEDAINYYQQAITIAQEIGDRRSEGIHLGNLGLAYHSLDQVEIAVNYYHQALAISQAIGDRRSEGGALDFLGTAYYSLGDVEKAVDYHQQALAIAQEMGDRRNEGERLSNLGLAYYSLGQTEKAIVCNEQALVITREVGFRLGEGEVLKNLGSIYHGLGQQEQAEHFWEEALRIFEQIKSPDAITVRKQLDSLKNEQGIHE